MNKISIRSTGILSFLGILSIVCLLIVENTKVLSEQKWYFEKLAASELSKKAQQYIKEFRFKNGVFIDNINDPNETGLIGEEFSPISTGRGSLSIKASTTNPNFAALVIALLKESGVQKGDKVAVCMTGSFPALNISTLAALQTLETQPIIISSVTSSTWGATDPNFTWLDIERELYKKRIFKHKSIAASIGGHKDIGIALSEEGRILAAKAIKRNKLLMINEGKLKSNIKKRIDLFNTKSRSKPIKLFINVGGGVASIGSKRNSKALRAGVNKNVKLIDFPEKKGTVFYMAQKKVPILHLQNLSDLMKTYNISYDPVPIPEVGEGSLYHIQKYNLLITTSCTIILAALIGVIVYQDRKRNQLGTDIIIHNEVI